MIVALSAALGCAEYMTKRLDVRFQSQVQVQFQTQGDDNKASGRAMATCRDIAGLAVGDRMMQQQDKRR